jgi:hypothetical protein
MAISFWGIHEWKIVCSVELRGGVVEEFSLA